MTTLASAPSRWGSTPAELKPYGLGPKRLAPPVLRKRPCDAGPFLLSVPLAALQSCNFIIAGLAVVVEESQSQKKAHHKADVLRMAEDLIHPMMRSCGHC